LLILGLAPAIKSRSQILMSNSVFVDTSAFLGQVVARSEAAELAERHGWTDDPAFGFICSILAGLLIWQARLEEAEPWLQSAERALGDELPSPLRTTSSPGYGTTAAGHGASRPD